MESGGVGYGMRDKDFDEDFAGHVLSFDSERQTCMPRYLPRGRIAGKPISQFETP